MHQILPIGIKIQLSPSNLRYCNSSYFYLWLYNYWEYVIECVFAVEGNIILKTWLILRIKKFHYAEVFLLNLCFFEPTWPFYLKFNLSKTIYFLKRTWFLYVLSKYQAMFKISKHMEFIIYDGLTGPCLRCQTTKVVPFQEKSSFHFVVLWKLLNGMN
jgi:hypothetical protein